MSSAPKDTIYIDIDDEITAIIDKVLASPQRIVALVLPKRAAVLQSIVNMKLLKHSADGAKKHVVLITSEVGLLPLAGVVGLHVAKTLQSKPAIPPKPTTIEQTTETVSEGEEPDIDNAKPVGELASLSPSSQPEETIEVDNDEEAAVATGIAAVSKVKKNPNKKLRVPNFNKFRVRLFVGVLAFVLLLVGWYVAGVVLPRAKITLKTDTSTATSDLTFVARLGLNELNVEQSLVPATKQEVRKTDTEKTAATGEKNIGEKAKGTVRLVNCSQADKLSDTIRTVPAGTAVSSGGFSFMLAESVEVEPSSFIGSNCQKNKKSDPVDVTAQNSGNSYNLSARDYQVSGFSSMTAQGSDMSGGTNKIVKVVSQQDIDNAKQKVLDRNKESVKEELRSQLTSSGHVALLDTLNNSDPTVVSTPNVGTEAGEVTISATMTFDMIGVKQTELEKLVKESVKNDIDDTKQSILSYGLHEATIRIVGREGNGDVRVALQTLVTIGPEIDHEALKKEIAGKKRGQTQNILQSRPGVKEAIVDYSPFWVHSTPRASSKITIQIESIAPLNPPADGNQ